MITTSEFILKLIENKGYKNINDFAKKNGLKRVFFYGIERNIWTERTLRQVSDILGCDLTRFKNSKINRV